MVMKSLIILFLSFFSFFSLAQKVKPSAKVSLIFKNEFRAVSLLDGELSVIRKGQICESRLLAEKMEDWSCKNLNKKQMRCETKFKCSYFGNLKKRNSLLKKKEGELKKLKSKKVVKGYQKPKILLRRYIPKKFVQKKKQIEYSSDYQQIEGLLSDQNVVDLNSKSQAKSLGTRELKKGSHVVSKTVGTEKDIAIYEMHSQEELEQEERELKRWYFDQFSFGVLSITDENEKSMGSGFVQWSPYKELTPMLHLRWNLLVHQIEAFVDGEKKSGFEGTVSFFGELHPFPFAYVGGGLGYAPFNNVKKNSAIQFWGELGWQNQRNFSILKRIFLSAQKSSNEFSKSKLLLGVSLRF